ncbi:HNH endonuclease [Streptomyces sp. NPDC001621]|uniref:HNH endonuclease n=1 Tax=Streptomyces sp. NPDC001621 TaxID=3364594 RepID=UPI0036CBB6E0
MDRERVLHAVASRGVRLPRQECVVSATRRRSLELPGGRRRTTAAARRGQDTFRKALVAEYGLICAVTGPAPAEVLEAAHLRPFATTERHRVEEGLLLRADVHRLFDSGLLTISPELVVHVAPTLLGHGAYSALDGRSLCVPRDHALDLKAVEEHYATTTATW